MKVVNVVQTNLIKAHLMLFQHPIVVIIVIALYADIAQVVERIHGKDEVVGSSPSIGTIHTNEN